MFSNNRNLTIRMAREARSGWNYHLQKGFAIMARAGMTVRQLMRESFGYDDHVIDVEVRTIFLNNSPVDNIDAIRVSDGDRIALGSAMPGVVGIVMGRDNPYKSFRSDISAVGDSIEESAQEIKIFAKIFSILAVDTGEDVLGRGIEMNAQDLADYLAKTADRVLDADGRPVGELVSELRETEGGVWIKVLFE